MQNKALARTFLASVAILSLSIPSLSLAAPKVKTRGPNGGFIPAMDKAFPAMAAKFNMTVTPFNLVFLAFQGFFASENIPSSMSLIQAYRQGKVTPEQITKAAISMNRLPAEALQDKEYLSNVKSQLDTLILGDN